MAKLINGLLGNSKNKIGSIVTYVSKGQQLARAKAANISNPRTASQMTQRIKLSNVVAMYRANKNWMDRYAFENKPTRWSVFNAFVSANLSASSVALTKQEAAAGAAVVAPYRMTDGTLPEIHVNENATTGLFETDLYTGELTLTAATTIGELSQALIANNNGIVNGMQLSLIENFQNVQNSIPRITTRAFEMIIDSTSTALVSTRISTASLVTGGTEGAHYLAYNETSGSAAQGIAFILSHTISGKTYVSPSVMTLADPGVYDSYSSSTAVDLAIASYGSANEIPFLDSNEVSASVSGDVDITPSILGVRVGTAANAVTAGQYLGDVAANATVAIQFNTLPSGTPSYVSLLGGNPDVMLTNITTSGTTITGTAPDAQTSVRAIEMDVDGVRYSIEFSTTDPGVTE